MKLENLNIEKLSKEITKKLFIEVEASGRHIHLSKEDLAILFGDNYELTKVRDLSQPGQYVCAERVTLIGPKGVLENVVILGPIRKETQIEISKTDAVALGINAPVRQSGDIKDTPGITIQVKNIKLAKKKGVIIAQRHVHLTPKDAEYFKVKDNETVKLKVFGERSVIFDNTVIRVREDFATYIHIDYDEANACGFSKGMLGLIIKQEKL